MSQWGLCASTIVCSCLATIVLIGRYLPTERVMVSDGWGNGSDRQLQTSLLQPGCNHIRTYKLLSLTSQRTSKPVIHPLSTPTLHTHTQDAFSKSDDPCSELYRGPSPGSELEVQALTSFIKSLGRVIGAVDFHSYHQKILYPPGTYTCTVLCHQEYCSHMVYCYKPHCWVCEVFWTMQHYLEVIVLILYSVNVCGLLTWNFPRICRLSIRHKFVFHGQVLIPENSETFIPQS